MMKGYSLERLYPNSTCALQECFTQFERLVELHLPDLYQLLTTNTMTSSSLYLPQWFQTVFLYSQRMDLSIRVMDLIIIRGIEALFRVGLAILTISEGTNHTYPLVFGEFCCYPLFLKWPLPFFFTKYLRACVVVYQICLNSFVS